MRQTELAWVAQLVERVLGKDEVTGSIPVPGSRDRGRGSAVPEPAAAGVRILELVGELI